MEQQVIEEILKKVHSGAMSVQDALRSVQNVGFGDMGHAKIDFNRSMRTGFPEIIFCQNKNKNHIADIVKAQHEHGETVFGTRAEKDVLHMIRQSWPSADVNDIGRCFSIKSNAWKPKEHVKGTIIVASAGTADAPVVEEARCTVEILGHPCETIQDVGVAGIHRLFAHQEKLQAAAAIIVIAGMEGALPSVVAGLVPCPVIAVPTSVGYGAHLNGLVPLFAMLNSCASGLTVVNIDNGFGAAMAAAKMNTVAPT